MAKHASWDEVTGGLRERRGGGVPRANPPRFRWSYIRVDIWAQKTSIWGPLWGSRMIKWGKNRIVFLSLAALEKVFGGLLFEGRGVYITKLLHQVVVQPAPTIPKPKARGAPCYPSHQHWHFTL